MVANTVELVSTGLHSNSNKKIQKLEGHVEHSYLWRTLLRKVALEACKVD